MQKKLIALTLTLIFSLPALLAVAATPARADDTPWRKPHPRPRPTPGPRDGGDGD